MQRGQCNRTRQRGQSVRHALFWPSGWIVGNPEAKPHERVVAARTSDRQRSRRPCTPTCRALYGQDQYFTGGLKRQDFGAPAVSATRRNGGPPLRESRIPVRLCVCNR